MSTVARSASPSTAFAAPCEAEFRVRCTPAARNAHTSNCTQKAQIQLYMQDALALTVTFRSPKAREYTEEQVRAAKIEFLLLWLPCLRGADVSAYATIAAKRMPQHLEAITKLLERQRALKDRKLATVKPKRMFRGPEEVQAFLDAAQRELQCQGVSLAATLAAKPTAAPGSRSSKKSKSSSSVSSNSSSSSSSSKTARARKAAAAATATAAAAAVVPRRSAMSPRTPGGSISSASSVDSALSMPGSVSSSYLVTYADEPMSVGPSDADVAAFLAPSAGSPAAPASMPATGHNYSFNAAAATTGTTARGKRSREAAQAQAQAYEAMPLAVGAGAGAGAGLCMVNHQHKMQCIAGGIGMGMGMDSMLPIMPMVTEHADAAAAAAAAASMAMPGFEAAHLFDDAASASSVPSDDASVFDAMVSDWDASPACMPADADAAGFAMPAVDGFDWDDVLDTLRDPYALTDAFML